MGIGKQHSTSSETIHVGSQSLRVPLQAADPVIQIIYRDEQGHVAVGAKWFRFLCHRERRDPAAAFQTLVQKHFRGALKPPFNDSARARAGLTPNLYRALASVSR